MFARCLFVWMLKGIFLKEFAMLVLGRYTNQSIHIGSNIVLHVIEARDGLVRLAIAAPSEIPVHRSEIVAKILAEGRTIPAVGVIQPTREMAG
jgi:carbon storage regulator